MLPSGRRTESPAHFSVKNIEPSAEKAMSHGPLRPERTVVRAKAGTSVTGTGPGPPEVGLSLPQAASARRASDTERRRMVGVILQSTRRRRGRSRRTDTRVRHGIVPGCHTPARGATLVDRSRPESPGAPFFSNGVPHAQSARRAPARRRGRRTGVRPERPHSLHRPHRHGEEVRRSGERDPGIGVRLASRSGVRSIREVLLHVVSDNYLLPIMMGKPAPASAASPATSTRRPPSRSGR